MCQHICRLHPFNLNIEPLPPFTVCSHTLYVGSGIFHTKSVSHVKDVLKEHGLGEPLSTQVVKGKKRQDDKVYIEMGDRETAEEALSKLTTSDEENEQKKLTVSYQLP